MTRAAEFRALAVISALLLNPHPGFPQAAGNGVQLDAEGRHGPGMENIVGGHQQADIGIDRNDDGLVRGQQAGLAVL